ncbi:outer membrane protein assembly factor BamD [Limibaculum sp. M0105]|uniref:Outer membrane protein assembly factor BamD n=1 Tax=Thermohalobaculum xanthum TaxID=2753746 RepID=A0A8J7SER5_9RHOB|nr:outer membrane protein assembly factor BamD [Thermohalobaculum xanthum]MBK0399676.1 outer membrane protein assembly factor BamD [Thermohalobaculum xanthum]
MTPAPRFLRPVAAIVLAASLSACSMFSGEKEPTVEDLSANEIFTLGQQQLADGQETAAAKTFNEIERLYPFSQLAKRALIMSAYASYEGKDYPNARASAQRYIDLYPSDADAPYAQYLIALTYYDNIVDVGRDQALTVNAMNEFTELVARYPDSDYAREAQLKLDLTRDQLAGKEMSVGRYYLKRGHYTAAINRFSVVIEKYQTTSQTPEALHRMVEAYVALGLTEEAERVALVLGTNFPGSEWYSDSYALLTGVETLPKPDESGTFNSLYRQIILGHWL